SLGGIAMGVGMIVDNSIVVLENIYRFSAEGHSRMEACVDGTKEVATAVMASTLTTLAVFVPLGLTTGLAGMMFRDFCLTISSLIGSSLIISLTLVPLLCYFMLDEEKVLRYREKRALRKPNALAARIGGWVNGLNRAYLRLLNYFIRHLKIGMLVSVLLVAGFSVTLISTKMVLIPEMDQGEITVSISMPIGSGVEESSATADRVAAIVQRDCPELKELFYIAQDESVTMMANLVSKNERERSSIDVVNDLRPALQDIAGCEITVSASQSMTMGSSNDISVKITGEDYETLGMIADDLVDRISQLPDAVDVSSSLSEKVPQVKVVMKREAAAQ
ncbi:MAG: efflux RND transporter permease subunit, partial [Lawsonibacter sp.]